MALPGLPHRTADFYRNRGFRASPFFPFFRVFQHGKIVHRSLQILSTTRRYISQTTKCAPVTIQGRLLVKTRCQSPVQMSTAGNGMWICITSENTLTGILP